MFNKFLNDELVNKVRYLSEALHNAEQNIKSLQDKNNCLVDALTSLASINKEDYEKCLETTSESTSTFAV